MTHVVPNLATSVKRNLLLHSSLRRNDTHLTSLRMSKPLRGPEALRAGRRRKKLTLEQLAERLSPPVTKQTVYKYEAGLLRISLKTALQLSALLDIPADLLSCGDTPSGAVMSKLRTGQMPVLGVAKMGVWAEKTSDVPPRIQPKHTVTETGDGR